MNDNQEKKVSGPTSDLPAFVPLLPGAEDYRASNRDDVQKIAELVGVVPLELLPALLGFIYGHGMMLISNWTIGGFIINRSLSVVKRKFNGNRYVATVQTFKNLIGATFEQTQEAATKAGLAGKAIMPKSEAHFNKVRENGIKTLEDMRLATMNHILNGKDREERNSVGGFSQRELTAVNNVIFLLALGEPLTIEEMRNKALGLELKQAA